MAPPRSFVDLHLHAEGLSSQDLETLALFGLAAAVTCAHDVAGKQAASVRAHWDDLVGHQTQRLAKAGIRPFVALGLHPAGLPHSGVSELLALLPRYFDDPRVVALGELGLHQGTPQEEEVFSAQLELACQLEKPVIVHTPKTRKHSRTRRLLQLLQESGLAPTRVLLDHTNEETLPLVRAFGCWAGLTVQEGALDAGTASALLKKYGAEGIVLTSDLGDGPADLLALPRAGEALLAAGLSEPLCRRALSEGPQRFLGL